MNGYGIPLILKRKPISLNFNTAANNERMLRNKLLFIYFIYMYICIPHFTKLKLVVCLNEPEQGKEKISSQKKQKQCVIMG